MSYPSVTYAFSNGSPIDATAINTNFSDLVTSLNSGIKDLNMRDATFGGSVQVDRNLTVSGNLTDTSGYICVNTITPVAPLTVDGSAYISGDIFSYPSGGGWADGSGVYTISGFSITPNYTYKHRRVGRTNYVNFEISGFGTLDSTSIVVGLPSVASVDSINGFYVSQNLNAISSTVPGMAICPAGYSDMTVYWDFAKHDFTGTTAQTIGNFQYDE